MSIAAGLQHVFQGAVKIYGRLYLGHTQAAVTAGTTQTQVGATKLTKVLNYVGTVAVSGDGVRLPSCDESRLVIIVNAGANSARVYSLETSGVTINATAGTTGVLQLSGTTAIYVAGNSGKWTSLGGANSGTAFNGTTGTFSGALTASGGVDGILGGVTPAAASVTTLAASSNVTVSGYTLASVGNALTAAGTTRADALQLAKEINNITTAASSTGVILPVGVTGMRIHVFNGGANAIKVYASASETIDGTSGATGVALTNAKRCVYEFVAANTWISAQLGVVSA